MNRAGVHLDAPQVAGGNFVQILTEAVVTIVGNGLAVFYDFFGRKGHTVTIEAGAANITGKAACHSDSNGITGGCFLDLVTLMEQTRMGIDGGKVQIPADAAKQLTQLLLVQHHRAINGKVRLHSSSSCLNFLQLFSNLLDNSVVIKGAEIILLIQLHTLGLAVVGGNGLHHGIVTYLGFVDSPAVADGIGAAVHEDFYGVQICVFQRIGGKDSFRDLCGQLGEGIGREIAFHCKLTGFVFRQLIHLIVEQQRLFHSLFNQLVQLGFCGGRIYVELGVTLKIIVIHIHSDDLVAGVGAADSFQPALHIEAFIAFFGGKADPVVADTGIVFQMGNDSFHPNFTFTFSAGPPSLTRTHSL